MKRMVLILLGALFFGGAFIPASHAANLTIEIGDRPYYTHGPFYWHRGHRWLWVPGHRAWRHHHCIWIHGHYVRR